MKLSDAMREGAKSGPQLFGYLGDGGGGSCAMGSVAIAMGVPDVSAYRFYRELQKGYPFLKTETECPACGDVVEHAIDGVGDGIAVIVHLNNHHRWSREAIAEWIDATFERGVPMEEIRQIVGLQGPRVPVMLP